MVKFSYGEVYIAYIRACQTNNQRLISELVEQLNKFSLQDVEGTASDQIDEIDEGHEGDEENESEED